MQHTERMIEVAEELRSHGHDVFLSRSAAEFVGKTDDEKEALKMHHKFARDAIRDFWRQMQGADALLVANFDKGGIPNYIGGNALMEIGFAHVMGQEVFLLNPVPDIPFYRTEIEAMRPTVLDGDLSCFVGR